MDAHAVSSVIGQESAARRGIGSWLAWLIGVAMVMAITVAALRFSETGEIARIAQHAEPWWVLTALLLQAGTYIAQGAIWRQIANVAQVELPRTTAFRLSLAKLFIDQALPSGGISGTLAVGKALKDRGVPDAAVTGGFVLNTASYFAAYILSLGVALLLAPHYGPTVKVVVLGSIAFIVLCAAMVTALLTLPGHLNARVTERLTRIRWLREPARLLAGADTAMARSPRLFAAACAWQLAIMLCDVATLWVLIRALGASTPVVVVFVSFTISNLFRTIGVLPGGLGAFEASSVLTLQSAGVPWPVALSATLLFRGLSFWLPMLPGLWFSRALTRGDRSRQSMSIDGYWALPPDQVLTQLQTTPLGLTTTEAQDRLLRFGPNVLRTKQASSRLQILARQFSSPLLLLLVFAAIVAALTGEWVNASIVLTIIIASALIGYQREYRAQTAAAALRERLHVRVKLLRDEREQLVPLQEVVPGDVVLLSAGSLVPADALALQTTDCYVSESVLTGESYPVEKKLGLLEPQTQLAKRTNCVFMGTNVRSGTLRAVVVATGTRTQFGAIARRLALRAPESEFDRSMRRFGYLLTSAMLFIVLLVFGAHMLAGRPVIDTLMFSIALAVGLSPELLPAILNINLARGAEMLAQRGVLVRRLSAIENLGSMDVLCTDKTGTLTEGVVRLEGGYGPDGSASAAVVELAALNASLQSGLVSPLDGAIVAACGSQLTDVQKRAEIPFDFVRKRVSVIVERTGGVQLITKGAFRPVLEVCTRLSTGEPLDDARRQELLKQEVYWSSRGVRVLAVARRDLPQRGAYGRDDERDLVYVGIVTFLDRPKEGAAEAIADLSRLGVSVKLITGDSRLVAQHVAKLVGLRADRVLTGAQLDELHDEALWHQADNTDLFVEVDPNQKERIILSLKKMSRVVGFLGDGVNDAPAMHAADTSLSVEQAVDVAREAADFVLLDRHLDVIRRGVLAGRQTFANTMKYVLTTTSANLGNMLSMALASVLLPFLPLLAGQILLNNFLSDIPAIGLAGDSVDEELIDHPRRWDMGFIWRFMTQFGALSSVFDIVTFGALLLIFAASPPIFRTGWFVESLLTQLLIALVVRTRRPFFRSKPGRLLLTSTILLGLLTPTIPYLPFAALLGFVPLPGVILATLMAITVLYVLAAEIAKRSFYRRAHG